MLEEMDLDGMGASPGATPQPSTVWSRGAQSHSGHAHPGEPEHDGDDSAEDEGTSWLLYVLPALRLHTFSFSALASSLPAFPSLPSFIFLSLLPSLSFPCFLFLSSSLLFPLCLLVCVQAECKQPDVAKAF